MKISICIPTYNRGHRALECVQNLLKLDYDRDKLEIVVSDNGSDKNTEGYKTISGMEDDRLIYHHFDENMGFLCNLNQVIRMSSGDYCMILSDEDSVDPIVFDYYYDQIRVHPDVHIIRPSSDEQYGTMLPQYAVSDKDAIDAFFCEGNYISGTFFDRSLLTDELVNRYYETYAGNRAYQDYPHLFYGAALLIHGGYYCDQYVLIHEGKGEDDSTYDPDATVLIQHYGTYEKRIEQMEGFVELINNLDTNDARKFQMLQVLCIKTSYLIDIVKQRYLAMGTDWDEIIRKEKADMKKYTRGVRLPFDENDWSAVDKFIDEIADVCMV